MSKKILNIEWSHDEHDCEDCGSSYSTGAHVTFDGEVLVDKKAIAHCYNGNGDVELEGILLLVLDKLGVEIIQEDDEECWIDLDWYRNSCYDMDSEGNFIKTNQEKE